ncbi:YchJ family protein [Vreelandella venusta]|uniref:YchJ family protein n=1 Tax=Vreelandella venusta TaxID=44935 RepID=UPI0018DAC588|nr:YchJ family metal-binding protein [Halomonas venusta]QPI64388.1 SEC-C domain-containing protein [Halomonas venusta]
MTLSTPVICPCGSGAAFAECCQPYHQGATPPTPEILMRSRYTAFALNSCDYLLATWHVSTRPIQLLPDPDTQWKALTIVTAPPSNERQGSVHFLAYFREQNRWHVLEENSRFVFEDGRWWYVDGMPTIERLKPRRNERCLCGSGRKIKSCCCE